MDKKGKIDFGEIKDDPQKRAQLIVGIAFMIGIIMFVAVSINNKNRYNYYQVDEKEINEDYEFDLSGIESDKYHFVLDVTIDNNKITYEGDSYNNKLLFSDSIDLFYKEQDKYYKKINDQWVFFDIGNNFTNYIRSKFIEDILKEAYFDSKTEYSDQTALYTYKILTPNLCEIIDSEFIDIDDVENVISLQTDDNNRVVRITYDISSYGRYKEYGNSTIINVEYSKFNNVDEINELEV